MPLPPEEGLEALVRRREAEARAASSAAVESILGIADPAERMRAYTEFRRGLEDGEALPAEAEQRVVQSLQAGAAPVGNRESRAMATTAWEVERRRLVVLHFARPAAAAGYVVLALLPFVAAAWRGRMGLWEALAAFLAPGWPLTGVVLALGVAGFLGRLVGKAASLEGLASLGVGAFVAGVVGLAVSVGLRL